MYVSQYKINCDRICKGNGNRYIKLYMQKWNCKGVAQNVQDQKMYHKIYYNNNLKKTN